MTNDDLLGIFDHGDLVDLQANRSRVRREIDRPGGADGSTIRRRVDPGEVLAFIEAYLAEHPYFGGQVFSAADIIMDMVVKFAAMLPGIALTDYPHFAAWQKTVEARPAFKRMKAAALPDGKVPNQGLTAALLRGAKAPA